MPFEFLTMTFTPPRLLSQHTPRTTQWMAQSSAPGPTAWRATGAQNGGWSWRLRGGGGARHPSEPSGSAGALSVTRPAKLGNGGAVGEREEPGVGRRTIESFADYAIIYILSHSHCYYVL